MRMIGKIMAGMLAAFSVCFAADAGFAELAKKLPASADNIIYANLTDFNKSAFIKQVNALPVCADIPQSCPNGAFLAFFEISNPGDFGILFSVENITSLQGIADVMAECAQGQDAAFKPIVTKFEGRDALAVGDQIFIIQLDDNVFLGGGSAILSEYLALESGKIGMNAGLSERVKAYDGKAMFGSFSVSEEEAAQGEPVRRIDFTGSLPESGTFDIAVKVFCVDADAAMKSCTDIQGVIGMMSLMMTQSEPELASQLISAIKAKADGDQVAIDMVMTSSMVEKFVNMIDAQATAAAQQPVLGDDEIKFQEDEIADVD